MTIHLKDKLDKAHQDNRLLIWPQSKDGFLSENFLLSNDFAKILYHDHAKHLPIIDYHCHLPPQDIATNRQFEDITSIWLEGDHYKWRAMRTLGVDEKYITGNTTGKEKFKHWAHTVPYTLRNPLFHWTHLELKRYFGIDQLLNPESADEIYKITSNQLKTKEFSTRNLLLRMNVETVVTTDDPIDSLDNHKLIKADNFSVKTLPAFRPDKAFAIENEESYKSYLKKLSEISGIEISSFNTLIEALEKSVSYFHKNGCRLSDHGLEQLYFFENSPLDAEAIFAKFLNEVSLNQEEIYYFKSIVLIELCKLYHKNGWVQQFHLGALRNTNERMLKKLGPDTGFDSIGDFQQSRALAKFLNHLDSSDQLSKTILYNLNPSDNEVFGTMIGNFNDGSIKGKVQFGSAWWFLDQKDGMEKQINSLSNLGLLSCFIGMLTDSRSFMSFPRHEYFRRILCNLIGKDVENGELPADEKWLGKIIGDICYHNAKEYFDF
jgi:glucuronate isomerase